MKGYRYYTVRHPIIPGDFPEIERMIGIANYDKMHTIPFSGKRVWGHIEYSHPLTPVVIKKYELIPETLDEDKEMICRFLGRIIKLTRAGADLISLDYDSGNDMVTACFQNGGQRKINVAGDSGIAIMKDIIDHLGF